MDVMQRITEIIHDFFDDDTIVVSEGLSAVDVPDWDSLNHIRLMVTIENEFGIRLETQEITNLPNIGALVNIIKSK